MVIWSMSPWCLELLMNSKSMTLFGSFHKMYDICKEIHYIYVALISGHHNTLLGYIFMQYTFMTLIFCYTMCHLEPGEKKYITHMLLLPSTTLVAYLHGQHLHIIDNIICTIRWISKLCVHLHCSTTLFRISVLFRSNTLDNAFRQCIEKVIAYDYFCSSVMIICLDAFQRKTRVVRSQPQSSPVGWGKT